MENIKEVFEFYNGGAEIGRLERGLGKVEFYRSKEILRKYINGKKIIYDIGGGVGRYSSWLAEQGHEVHLLELAPSAVEYAKNNQNTNGTYIAEVCDARNIIRDTESADIVLLMGPLYHLQNKADRMLVLNEAYRVLKKDGIIFCVGISRFCNATWSVQTYLNSNTCLDDEAFFKMMKEELETGCHNRPKEYPYFLSKAYFSTPIQMQTEIVEAGFKAINRYAIEGILWFTPLLDDCWEDVEKREKLLSVVRMTENEEELMGMSPHFMVISRK